jgi:M3 family oligoendopeptidase
MLRAEYTSLIAGISVPFAGTTLNLPGLAKYASDPDRDVRYAATRARWTALEERGPELDRIYDDLVRVRTGIAQRLGFADFTALAYRRMRRVDYGRADVERYREAVRTDVVPVAAAVAARAARRHGIARLALWDEALIGGPSNPVPHGDAAWIMDRTIEGFGDLDPRLGEFVRMMHGSELTDLVTRPGKAGGGYCTMLPSYGVPFVFTNFNGTQDDVRTLMHELGHAFQAWSSRAQPVIDYVSPTLESAEIHSMSLEYLSWPLMDRFFGAEADAYRAGHLAHAMLFLPYGVAVDHFQHLVYERPSATPAERHAMWTWVEQRYLPWRAYGDLARPAAGAFWQSQQHVYTVPFYYIDYTLALCCALQFWVAASEEPQAALARYLALCGRGGEAAFGELVAGAGLRSPFDATVLRGVVARAKDVLAV